MTNWYGKFVNMLGFTSIQLFASCPRASSPHGISANMPTWTLSLAKEQNSGVLPIQDWYAKNHFTTIVYFHKFKEIWPTSTPNASVMVRKWSQNMNVHFHQAIIHCHNSSNAKNFTILTLDALFWIVWPTVYRQKLYLIPRLQCTR